MSEKIYSWLLYLYPAHFRKAYGDEALQLVRDRASHERGFSSRLQLWLDLLADLAISLPRQHRRQPALSCASVGGGPLFRILDGEAPRLEALFLGGVLTLVTLSGSVSIGHLLKQHSPKPGRTESRSLAFQVVTAEAVKLDAAERHRIIQAVVANVGEHYIDRGAAGKIAEALRAHEKSGDYDAVTEGSVFADLLTKQVRIVSHDLNLEVVYSKSRLPDGPPGMTPESVARYRKAMEQENCTFEPVKILPHSVGYLKLNAFPDPAVCQATATAAMASLNHADAVIFDLRDNRGGYPAMVMLIASYLFDHPEYMYNPRENTSERMWTRSPVPGSKLADKPVYVLTSARTFSGAEHFSYDLKMLKRATLVGETTGGAAHSGVFHRIDEHFGMGIPETKAINPFSETDWAVTGVEPDVKVKAADALDTAEKLAQSKLRKK